MDSPALPASLPQGQTLSVPVTFAPTDTDIGTVGGQITIQTDAGSVSVPVSAIGQSATPPVVTGENLDWRSAGPRSASSSAAP